MIFPWLSHDSWCYFSVLPMDLEIFKLPNFRKACDGSCACRKEPPTEAKEPEKKADPMLISCWFCHGNLRLPLQWQSGLDRGRPRGPRIFSWGEKPTIFQDANLPPEWFQFARTHWNWTWCLHSLYLRILRWRRRRAICDGKAIFRFQFLQLPWVNCSAPKEPRISVLFGMNFRFWGTQYWPISKWRILGDLVYAISIDLEMFSHWMTSLHSWHDRGDLLPNFGSFDMVLNRFSIQILNLPGACGVPHVLAFVWPQVIIVNGLRRVSSWIFHLPILVCWIGCGELYWNARVLYLQQKHVLIVNLPCNQLGLSINGGWSQ